MASLIGRSLRVAQVIPRVTMRQLSTTNSLSTQLGEIDSWPTDKLNNHYISSLNRPEIDGWEIRKVLTELSDVDIVPDPVIVAAALRAIRRVNDYGLALRFLENLKWKCGSDKNRKTVYPWIISQVQPVLDELSISTPEELGMDKPEFFVPDPLCWWEKKWYKEYGLTNKPGYEHFG